MAREKHAFAFDFDRTLTTEHVENWNFFFSAPSQEKCSQLLKAGVTQTFRYLAAMNYPSAVITNGEGYRVPHVFKKASQRGIPALTEDEMKNIDVYSANSEYKEPRKKQAFLRDFANKHVGIKFLHYYDDDPLFCEAIREIIPKFAEKGIVLTVTQVDPQDVTFMSEILFGYFPNPISSSYPQGFSQPVTAMPSSDLSASFSTMSVGQLPQPLYALQDAAFRGNFDEVKTLVEKGANVNERNTAGLTAIQLAAGGNHFGIVNYLLDQKGIDVLQSRHTRPIDCASNYGSSATLQRLIDKYIALGDKNFSNLNLRGINFKGKDLRGGNFVGSDLSGADLSDTTLGGAKFFRANLSGVDLSNALVDDAMLVWATNMDGMKTELVEVQVMTNNINLSTCTKWLDVDPARIFSHKEINRSRLIHLDRASRILMNKNHETQAKTLYSLRKILAENQTEPFSASLAKWNAEKFTSAPTTTAATTSQFSSDLIQKKMADLVEMLNTMPEKYLKSRQLQEKVVPTLNDRGE